MIWRSDECVLLPCFNIHPDIFVVTVACRGLMMSGATAWLDAPLPNSSIEQWRMVVIVTGISCLWRHNMTSYSHLQTNVLAKFVDTICIFREAGAAVGKGRSKTVEGNGILLKTKKIVTKCVSFCWSSMLTSKNNINYWKSFWFIWVLERLQWLCFMSILINYEITYDADMKSNGVGGGSASASPKVLICPKSGQHPWKSW